MRYWYQKERYETGGHYDFLGHRELIYRGKDKPEEFIVRHLEFPPKGSENIVGYHKRFNDTVKIISSQEYLDEYENGSDISTKIWKIDWKVLTNYHEVYYSHNPTDIVEITEEQYKMITDRTVK